MNEKPNFFGERGQSLVIVALIMVALIAMLALVLDGGNTYFQRRNAQNAADAAALAGANVYCSTNDLSAGQAAANSYATMNGFTLADFTVTFSPTVINVTTSDTFDTYFGGVIGWPQMTVEAQAASSCCSPLSSGNVLPIAWVCKHPSNFNQGASSSDDCLVQYITPYTLTQYIQDPPPAGFSYDFWKNSTTPYKFYKELYLVMDSASTPADTADTCIEFQPPTFTTPVISDTGTLDCDFDNDGENDLIANGDRSWLDLNGGGGGASELSYWITNGWNGPPISSGTWVGGQSGVANSVFQSAAQMVGKIVAVPIYDEICDDYPSTACPSVFQPGDQIITTAGGNWYYRITAFAKFYILCVNAPGVPGPECQGHQYATDNGIIAENMKTIEGYFVQGDLPGNYPSDCSGTGIDVGSFVTRLTR